MPYKYTRQQRLEIITGALSCLTAGFLYIILVITLPLTCPINWVILIIGVLLLLLAPALLILTYKRAYKPKAQKLLRVIRIPLVAASLISIIYAVFRTGELLKNMNLSWISVILICYVVLCIFLVIIAEVVVLRER
jgi:small-conductance mechanosensitive channel